MFCKYCGNQLSNEANFCPKCGRIVANEESKKEEKYDFFEDKTEYVQAPSHNDKAKDEFAGEILKFAILGLAFGCTMILSILGIIFSSIARAKLRQYTQYYGETEGRASVGKGISIGGTIVSWVMAAIGLLYIVVIIAALGSGGVDITDLFSYYYY